MWMRANGKLGDDPTLHCIVAAYAPDLSLLPTALLPHGFPEARPADDGQDLHPGRALAMSVAQEGVVGSTTPPRCGSSGGSAGSSGGASSFTSSPGT